MIDKNRVSLSKDQRFCSHAGCDIEIETVFVDPPEILPDSPPRINQRTCSHFLECNLQDKESCAIVLYFNQEASETKSLLE